MPLDGATCVTRAILQSSVEQILFRQPVEALHSVPQLESVSRSEGPATQAPASKAQIDSNVADPERELIPAWRVWAQRRLLRLQAMR